MSKPPILIFGVPRSGTTLLRTLLNGHPNIACGPEAPWLADHQRHNVMALFESLTSGEFAFSRNFGVPPDRVLARLRELVDGLFTDFATQQGKARWAHKTPDDSLYAPFFTQLFPEARYLHIVRHPLDVALSTARIPPHRIGISPWHEENIVLEPGCAARNTLFNCVLRWRRWNDRLRADLAGRACHRVSYEDLVTSPEKTMAGVFAFLDEPFTPAILDYAKSNHIFPSWEWGSADVRQAGRITASRVGRWKTELTPDEARLLLSLAGPHDAATPPAVPVQPVACLANASEAASPLFTGFAAGLNAFAEPFALTPLADSAQTWGAPWLWFNGLSSMAWSGARVLALGSGLSPWPWLLAVLGARMTLVATDPQWIPAWQSLRNRLRVTVDWHVGSMETLPLDEGGVDVVTGMPSLEGQPDWRKSLSALVRLLKPGGMFAFTVGLRDSTRGTVDAGRSAAQAMSLREFEQEIWSHPAFDRRGKPQWNIPSAIDGQTVGSGCAAVAAILTKS